LADVLLYIAVMSKLVELETARLRGRRIRPDDFELLRQLLQNSQVAATLGGLRTDDEVREILSSALAHWDRFGFGRWLWHNRSDGRFVGRAGLNTVEIDDRNEMEVGYALLPEFWGQGLATEMARASVNVAFHDLGLAELVCFTLPTNIASRRVMEKAGFVFERDFVWKNLPHVLYRLKR
jgi:[ribosomal protein S5]-alanine N-acetyltransferase